jgi:hypothetical protein
MIGKATAGLAAFNKGGAFAAPKFSFLAASVNNFAATSSAIGAADTANSTASMELTRILAENAAKRKGLETDLAGSVAPKSSAIYS